MAYSLSPNQLDVNMKQKFVSNQVKNLNVFLATSLVIHANS